LGQRRRIGSVALMAGIISMGARREVLSAVAERYWLAGRVEKGCVLEALCRTTGWHRKHAVRALRQRVDDKAAETPVPRKRKRRYGVTIKDALTALWEASDRVCGKRLVVMIPTLLPALEQHGRLLLSEGEHVQLLTVSAATVDRILGDVKIAAAGGRRRRAGFYPRSVVRCRFGHSMTGGTRRLASARSTWWRMAAHPWLARSSRL
jgi:hypothetical protein